MKKRVFRLLTILAFFTLFGVLAACGGGGTSGADGHTPTAPGGVEPSEEVREEIRDIATDVVNADLNVTITLGNWPPDTAPAQELALFDGFREVMRAQYPNVTVIPAFFSYTLANYLPMARGGTAPNLFQPPFTDPQLLINQGLVADVTDALAEFGLLEKFSPSYIELLGDENGRLFGLPRDGYVLGMHINIDLFREAGLMDENDLPLIPTTLHEMAETGRIIRERTGAAGLVFPASETFGGWLFSNMAWNFGAFGEHAMQYQDADGNWRANFTSPPMVEAMYFMRSLRWDYDILNADATTTDWAGSHNILGTGRAAMNFAANDSVAEPTAGRGLPVDSFALAPFPAGPGGSFALTGGTAFMFSPDTSHDQALAILGFLQIIGVLPVITDDTVAAMRAGAISARDRGVPVLPPIPAWNDEEFIAQQRAIAAEFSNVDMRLYDDFFDSLVDGRISLRGEEPVFTQQMYRELTAVIQRLITREIADVLTALEQAEGRFQEFLDDMINR
ncbi:MAG: extracellular solute-binding protein [Defluviitaleaceae bacterium]|nr:extracellular solute-binding protein [Defluviitaleaceae bacterium]